MRRRSLLPLVLLAVPAALGACSVFQARHPTFVVFFQQGSVTVDDPARAVVADAARAANAAPTLPVVVSPYISTDATPGSDEVGRARQRAELVSQQLQADGVLANRVRITPPAPDPETPTGVASRRVEIDVGR